MVYLPRFWSCYGGGGGGGRVDATTGVICLFTRLSTVGPVVPINDALVPIEEDKVLVIIWYPPDPVPTPSVDTSIASLYPPLTATGTDGYVLLLLLLLLLDCRDPDAMFLVDGCVVV